MHTDATYHKKRRLRIARRGKASRKGRRMAPRHSRPDAANWPKANREVSDRSLRNTRPTRTLHTIAFTRDKIYPFVLITYLNRLFLNRQAGTLIGSFVTYLGLAFRALAIHCDTAMIWRAKLVRRREAVIVTFPNIGMIGGT